jgi:hypothetical protein
MKRLRLSIQVVVALLAIAVTLAAKGNILKSTVLRTTDDCYINPTNATVGACVTPSLLRNTDMCTEPPLAYCCYTFTPCGTKVKVFEIILYRGD